MAIIHKGRVQAEGNPGDLLERFDQPDLEELFFALVERADARDISRSDERRPDRTRGRGRDGLLGTPRTGDDETDLMRWSNLFAIFRREVLDQLRDRRTLFMIFVFPILLYPILGLGRAPGRRPPWRRSRGVVVMVGAEHLPPEPSPAERARRRLRRRRSSTARAKPRGCRSTSSRTAGPGTIRRTASRRSASGLAAAVMVIPHDLPEQFRTKNDVADPDPLPTASTSPARSPICGFARCSIAGSADRRGASEARTKLPEGYIQPIEVKGEDAADRAGGRRQRLEPRSSRSCW